MCLVVMEGLQLLQALRRLPLRLEEEELAVRLMGKAGRREYPTELVRAFRSSSVGSSHNFEADCLHAVVLVSCNAVQASGSPAPVAGTSAVVAGNSAAAAVPPQPVRSAFSIDYQLSIHLVQPFEYLILTALFASLYLRRESGQLLLNCLLISLRSKKPSMLVSLLHHLFCSPSRRSHSDHQLTTLLSFRLPDHRRLVQQEELPSSSPSARHRDRQDRPYYRLLWRRVLQPHAYDFPLQSVHNAGTALLSSCFVYLLNLLTRKS
jgi:hypothetical protein